MTLAIFDLDNTLIAGDSDHLWGDYLVARGIVDAGGFKAANDQFYQDYVNGQLDVHAYLRFALRPLTEHPEQDLLRWREEFMAERIAPLMLPKAAALLAEHRAKGHFLLIITATNDFITAPIAERLGVDHLIASSAARDENGYTGDIAGVPCYREGKITRLEEWLAETDHNLAGAYFYSDSHNDLPLLRKVDNPVAVDADPTLAATAREQGWPIISLR